MKPGKISVRDLMAATVIVGADLAAIRALWLDDQEFPKVISMTLPMVGLLAIGLLVLVRARGKTANPFLVGFEVAGWVATALYLASAWRFEGPTSSLVTWLWEPFPAWLRSLGYDPNGGSLWWMAAHFTLLAQTVFWLQMAVAVIGGTLHARYRFRFTIERRRPRGESRVVAEPGEWEIPGSSAHEPTTFG